MTFKQSGAMYVDVQIRNTIIPFLVDTGASTTMISAHVWRQLSNPIPTLSRVDTTLAGVDGRPLQVKGKCDLIFKLQAFEVPVQVVVANISISGILGADFLQKYECAIHLGSKPFMCIGRARQVVPLQEITSDQSYKVALAQNVRIPAESEIIVEGHIEFKYGEFFSSEGGTGLLEAESSVTEHRQVVIGRALVDTTRGTVPIRLFNPTAAPLTLYKGTHVGVVSPICGIVDANTSGVGCSELDLPPDLEQLLDKSRGHVSDSELILLRKFLQENRDLFACSGDPLGSTGVVKHTIDTGDARPIRQHPRRLPFHSKLEAQKELEDMLEQGVVSPSDSAWASPVVLVKKKDGTLRFCIDYRKMNNVTRKDAFPLPRIDDSLDALSGSKWFSTLDLKSGYWQVEMDPKDKSKTAFSMGSGLYEFNVMPFGLCNAPATFQRLMEQVLRGLHWEICLIYIDDIIIYANNFEEHIKRLGEVFGRLRNAGLKLKPSKCELCKAEVKYLGHVVTEQGIRTDPDKIKAVSDWATPTNLKQLRGFLGLCSYYRKFINHFAEIASPLHALTKKNESFIWSSQCEESFQILKSKLVTAPTLAYPNFDQIFILDTDASDKAIGAVLSQVHEGYEHPVAFASRTLSCSERKYSVTRRELLAVVTFIKHFRPYLYGKKFLLRTDHGSLRWLYNFKSPEGQVARWLEILGTYDFDIETRPGRVHGNADALSRGECGVISPQGTSAQPYSLVGTVSNWVESCSNDQLRKHQLQDKHIGVVLKWMEEGARPPWEKVSGLGRVVKAYWAQWDLLVIHEGVLYRRWLSDSGSQDRDLMVVPQILRKDILSELHNSPTAGHLGQKKTRGKLLSRYYWFGMKREVESWCRKCELCARRKAPSPHARAQMKVVKIGEPMQRVAMDVLGPLPETYNGNKYIVVIADYFTRWTEAYPIPNQEAQTVASVFLDFVGRFGVPQTLHTDQGSNFESALFRELCNVLGIEKTRTTAYRPQSDGLVERFNRTLEQMLSVYVHENQKDWDIHVPLVLMAYRSSPQETTGYSPNLLMLGRETTLPVELMIGPPVPRDTATTTSEYVDKFADRCEKAYSVARDKAQHGQNRQKRHYDARIFKVASPYAAGDKVWQRNYSKKKGLSPKLQLKWNGPFVVVKKLSDCLYRIRPEDSQKLKVVHIDRLKKYESADEVIEGQNVDESSNAGQRDACSDNENDHNILDRQDPINGNEMSDEVVDDDEGHRPEPSRRRRRPPAWMQDYEQY